MAKRLTGEGARAILGRIDAQRASREEEPRRVAERVFVTVRDVAWAGDAVEVLRQKLLAAGARGVRLQPHGDDVRLIVVYPATANIGAMLANAVGGNTSELRWSLDFRGFDLG